MGQQSIDLVGALDAAREAWRNCLDRIAPIVGMDAPVHGLDCSLREYSDALAGALETLHTLAPLGPSNPWIVDGLPSIAASLEAITKAHANWEAPTKWVDEKLQNLPDPELNVVGRNLNARDGKSIDFVSPLVSARDAVKSLPALFCSLAPFSGQTSAPDLAVRASEWDALLSGALEARSKLSALARLLKATTEELNAIVSSSAENKRKGEEFTAQLSDLKAGGEQGIQEITAKVEVARELTVKVGSLQTQVDAYQSKFDAFQKLLDDRTESFEKYEHDIKTVCDNWTSSEAEVDRLIAKANGMLASATVAGLSVRFDTARERYGEEASKAKTSFQIAVLVMLLAAATVAVYALEVPVPVVGVVPGDNASVAGLLGRLVLLFPTLIYIAFASRRHAVYFNLEREYGFKAALAQSVEGFGKEAPRFKQEIAAAIFMELTRQPTGTLPKGADPTINPVKDSVLKMFLDHVRRPDDKQDEKHEAPS